MKTTKAKAKTTKTVTKTVKPAVKAVAKPKKIAAPKNKSSVLFLTVILAIVTIAFLSFLSYRAMKSKRVVIDMGKYVLINEDNKNTVNPGKMEFPTAPPSVIPPTARPEIK